MPLYAPPAAAASSDLVQIASVTLGAAAAFDFTSIPQTYSSLQIVFSGRANDSGGVIADLVLLFNGDNSNLGTNYDSERIITAGTTAPTTNSLPANNAIYIGQVTAGAAAAGLDASCVIDIPGYTSSRKKTATGNNAVRYNTSGTGIKHITGCGFWINTAAITRIQVQADAVDRTFAIGSTCTLYGMK